MGRVARRRIEAAIRTLGDLTEEDHEALDPATRDEVSHVIDAMDEILEARP